MYIITNIPQVVLFYITVTKEGEYSVLIETSEGCKAMESVFMFDAFVPIKVGSLQLNGVLVEQMAIGKINWFRQYYPHGYDGSVMSCDYFIKNNEAPVRMDWMSNKRKKLMELTSDHPKPGGKIYELDFSNPFQVIKWYNSDE